MHALSETHENLSASLPHDPGAMWVAGSDGHGATNPHARASYVARIMALGVVVHLVLTNALSTGLPWASVPALVVANMLATLLTIALIAIVTPMAAVLHEHSPATPRFLWFIAVGYISLVIDMSVFFITYNFAIHLELAPIIALQLASLIAFGVVITWIMCAHRLWTFTREYK